MNRNIKPAGTNPNCRSVNANSKIPAIDSRCALSNVNTWLLTSDNKTVMTPNNSYVHVQACGGGGGGSPYAGGGSGGKIDKLIQLASNISKVYLTIGGGGGGGYGGVKGTTGTDSSTVPKGGQIGANTIWKSNSYCDGGNGGNSGTMPTLGKPGALRLYYTYPALKCDYSLPANGGGGGGAAR